jgi:outer membrane protein assembly factor BamB
LFFALTGKKAQIVRAVTQWLRALGMGTLAGGAFSLFLLAGCSGAGSFLSAPTSSADKTRVELAQTTSGNLPVYSDWNTFGDDLKRSGYNAAEATLSAGNITANSLKLSWSTDLGAAITTQPLVATGVAIGGVPMTVLYIGAENNIFYALNADTGAIIWKNTALGSSQSKNCAEVPGGQFGITGTATYDKAAGVVYVADANDNVNALNMVTGLKEWSTNVLFDPNTNTIVGAPSQDHIYGALTLNKGMLYVETASFCEDVPPFHGRIAAISTATHTVVAAFFPGRTSSGKSGTGYCGGGIWGMGGASIDSVTNDIFVGTGNIVTATAGGCTANSSGETYPYGDAIVQLDANLNLISFSTATIGGKNVSNDSDYGATPMLYNVSSCPFEQLSAKNKVGYLYTYSVGTSGLSAEQQLHVGQSTSAGQFIGVPAFDPVTGLVFVGNPNANGAFAHGLNALQEIGGCNGLNIDWKASVGSSNATSQDNEAPTVANGVVYFTDGVDNKVWAFDAQTGAQLWNSGTIIGSPCTSYGLACGTFGAPTVDGRVFVGSFNHKLYAFGLVGHKKP